MIQTVAILGRQPALGLAELESLYGPEHLTSPNPVVAGIDVPHSQIDFARLGGSTKLCKVIAEIPGNDYRKVEQHLIKNLPDMLQHLPEGKLKLGLSTIGLTPSPAQLTASGLTLKKVIKKAGRSVRLVPNQTQELSTAQVLHNKLTGELGWELVAVATSNKTTLLCQTVSVQNIDSYTLRDRGRPKRDARVGMLPPKLAQIIINLAVGPAKPELGGVVLDPFCGTGVVLIEASLMGFDVYGTDLEARMIEYSKANLDWMLTLPQNRTTPHQETIAPLEVGDGTTHQWKPAPQFVAAETYLGKPFTEKPSAEVLAQTASEVNLILKRFLQNIYTQLAPGTRLCLGVPAWQTAPHHFKHLPLIDQLGHMGYNRVSFEHVRDEQLLYYREDQIVARELLVLTRK